MSYTWKVSTYKQDANMVAQYIGTLGNDFTMHDIVEMARPRGHYMHDMFEWNNSIAGEKYREEQARKIVRLLVVYNDEKQEVTPVRVFYSNPDKPKVFTPTTVIIRNEDNYQKLLKTALAELQAFRRKYASLSELSGVFDAIDEL